MDIVDDDKSSAERTARISNITLVVNAYEQEKGINIQEPPHINDDISLDDATVDSVATFIDYVSWYMQFALIWMSDCQLILYVLQSLHVPD